MKRLILPAVFCIAVLSSCCDRNSANEQAVISGYSDKEAITNILERKSVRTFTDQAVEQEKIDLLMRAGMAAPSGMDRRPWEIIVVNDREVLDALVAEPVNSRLLAGAPLGIIVCGNTETSPIWYQDCSAVIQNILLAAEALDLGAVWTGAYPSEERYMPIQQVLGLPENIVPLGVVPVGYPDSENSPKDKYDQAKVHYNKW